MLGAFVDFVGETSFLVLTFRESVFSSGLVFSLFFFFKASLVRGSLDLVSTALVSFVDLVLGFS